MKNWRRELIELIVPSLPEYGQNPIVLVGCRSSDVFYEPCEIDVLIFDSKNEGTEYVAAQGGMVKIHRAAESATQIARDKPIFVSHAQPLHDPHLTLGGIFGPFALKFRRRWIREGITEAMVLLGRAKACERARDEDSARLWLMASAYMLIGSLLIHSGMSYSPSHFMTMLKSQENPLARRTYAQVAEILGLNFADKISVGRRLEALDKILQKYGDRIHQRRVIGKKVQYLAGNDMLVEAHSMLGYRILESIGLFNPLPSKERPPEAYRIAIPTATKRKTLHDLEEPFQDISEGLENTIAQVWGTVAERLPKSNG